MNRILMTLTFSLFLLNLCLGQIPKEAFPLTDSLSDLWHNGETEKAIESSLELYRLYPPMFIESIHNTLAQQLQNDPKLYGQKYLEQLRLKKNDEISNIISPIYLWSKSINEKNENDLKEILKELNSILKDSSNYKSETERYCLLILQELDKKNAIDAKNKEIILHKNINNLEAYPYVNKVIVGRSEGVKRAWHRYLLAYSYNYLYTVKPNVAEYLKKASDYSPDQNDRQYKHAYFYDAALLTGNTREFGFQTKYQKYLVENNLNSEALDLLSDIAFGNPSDYNIKTLREFYEKLKYNRLFTDYWANYIHKKGKPVPKLKIRFEKEELDLTKEPGKWIYIDVWGTWCSPCVKELPELQSFFVENNKSSNSRLEVCTFSFSSQNLSEFMTKNKYTFPVSEIDKRTNDLFEVSGYPTKILISPQGNFIKIPFGVDWKIYIKNYTMM
ncbi:alkyl hydroperoxide reductase/ Thiol specific antioxidant/ Mal allergen [Paludibacter propionicigenes WB4]|uniref:Alkyl hydroperoxide reductase/ Thiol specific antioxidant/ Mal allergen n=1 Tax=Paludibacter propionicigenes (strain DSM 17365 / JCM 13257 / WB4) TaxID=694427 RepID=E4T5M5_PALPW|nr:TlpA disulfide reductase family protein [Paludibacter propionicigenes]ADQ80019.1 alkyl hydroperoxide reductase/ Thiol specific antioxidant/ Mal allergen [Paludibacter propionicigenes WB4]